MAKENWCTNPDCESKYHDHSYVPSRFAKAAAPATLDVSKMTEVDIDWSAMTEEKLAELTGRRARQAAKPEAAKREQTAMDRRALENAVSQNLHEKSGPSEPKGFATEWDTDGHRIVVSVQHEYRNAKSTFDPAKERLEDLQREGRENEVRAWAEMRRVVSNDEIQAKLLELERRDRKK